MAHGIPKHQAIETHLRIIKQILKVGYIPKIYLGGPMLPMLRVREIITSWNSRLDLCQIGLI